MKNIKKIIAWILVICVFVGLAVLLYSLLPSDKMNYSDFITYLNDDIVESVSLKDNKATVVLRETKISVRKDSKGNEKSITFEAGKKYDMMVYSQAEFESLINERLSMENPAHLNYESNVQNIPYIVQILPYIILIGLAVIILFMILSQNHSNNSQAIGFGRSNARLYTKSNITFDDVAGAKEEKEEMAELVSFLKNPKKYSDMGARVPKGVLMVGPPGTGKTYLAKALAGEAGVPFFYISGSDFVEMYVGVGASRVRDLFEQAKKNSPSIVFIDEIDAVGRHRGAGLGGGHDEREQTLNQLLVEMDGFSNNSGIIVIAATNRPDILDPALVRPGRFDRKIVVGYPDIKAREEILRVHAKNKHFEEEVDFSETAKNTAGFTAADLENLLNEAALLATREGKDKIGMFEMKEATFKVIVGPEKKSHIMTDQEKDNTAVHEAGHAILCNRISSTVKVDRVSIVPAGFAGGYTSYRPDEDRNYLTKEQLIEEIIISLGGRVAEKLVFGTLSTGASSDLKSANKTARSIVTNYGMGESLTNMVFGSDSGEVFIGKEYGHSKSYSEETAAAIDKEVKEILDGAYNKAVEVLTENMGKLEALRALLLEKEKVEKEEFEALMNA